MRGRTMILYELPDPQNIEAKISGSKTRVGLTFPSLTKDALHFQHQNKGLPVCHV